MKTQLETKTSSPAMMNHVLGVCLLCIAGVTISWDAAPAAAPATPTDAATAGWTAVPTAEWKPVDFSRTAVEPGSALDMSRFVEAPAGNRGRVALDERGHLVFANRPNQRVTFFGCSISPEHLLGRSYTTKEEIRRWAQMVRRQGYNFVRPHFLDHYLTAHSQADLEFDPAAVTAIAVDDCPLAESRRILLVYATDALNSGMTFTAPDRQALVALGRPPVLMRTGKLKLTLAGRRAAGWKLWALGLDGRRVEELKTMSTGNPLAVSLDTADLKAATPFFEIVTE